VKYYRNNFDITYYITTPSLCNGVLMTHSDINKVKVISELLCIRHSYVNLDCFNSDDIDFMIEFMCTD